MGQAGDSFETLYDRQFRPIFRYVLRRVANVAEAEDLTAQTFYKALRSYWRVRLTAGDTTAWLYRIATNEVNSHFRRRREHVEPETEALESERRDAESELSRHRLFLDLHGALRTLRQDDQALIVLRYFEQLPYEQIVPILGGKPGALAMRASRALRKLKDELGKRGIDHEELRGFLADAEHPRPRHGDVSLRVAR